MNYQKKYLEYKRRYLRLKEQVGGDDLLERVNELYRKHLLTDSTMARMLELVRVNPELVLGDVLKVVNMEGVRFLNVDSLEYEPVEPERRYSLDDLGLYPDPWRRTLSVFGKREPDGLCSSYGLSTRSSGHPGRSPVSVPLIVTYETVPEGSKSLIFLAHQAGIEQVPDVIGKGVSELSGLKLYRYKWVGHGLCYYGTAPPDKLFYSPFPEQQLIPISIRNSVRDQVPGVMAGTAMGRLGNNILALLSSICNIRFCRQNRAGCSQSRSVGDKSRVVCFYWEENMPDPQSKTVDKFNLSKPYGLAHVFPQLSRSYYGHTYVPFFDHTTGSGNPGLMFTYFAKTPQVAKEVIGKVIMPVISEALREKCHHLRNFRTAGFQIDRHDRGCTYRDYEDRVDPSFGSIRGSAVVVHLHVRYADFCVNDYSILDFDYYLDSLKGISEENPGKRLNCVIFCQPSDKIFGLLLSYHLLNSDMGGTIGIYFDDVYQPLPVGSQLFETNYTFANLCEYMILSNSTFSILSTVFSECRHLVGVCSPGLPHAQAYGVIRLKELTYLPKIVPNRVVPAKRLDCGNDRSSARNVSRLYKTVLKMADSHPNFFKPVITTVDNEAIKSFRKEMKSLYDLSDSDSDSGTGTPFIPSSRALLNQLRPYTGRN